MPLPGLLSTAIDRNIALAANKHRLLHVPTEDAVSSVLRSIIWRALSRPSGVTLLIANDMKWASHVQNEVTCILATLPIVPTEKFRTHVRLENNHLILARSASASAARGLFVDSVYWHLVDHTDERHVHECWLSIMPCLSQGGSAIISTSSGVLHPSISTAFVTYSETPQ